MERIVILNGSPRAPKSNSKCYANPSVKSLEKILNALDVSFEDFFKKI